MSNTKVDMTIAQMTYIEQNYDKLSLKELSQHTGLTQAKIRPVVKKLESLPKPEKEKDFVKEAGYDVKNGAVVMTAKSSAGGDGVRGNSNTELFNTRNIGIHIINPNKETQ